jgi:hypothetical protein
VHERQRHVVEGALHVEGGRELLLVHPQHAEAPLVRQHVPFADLVDVLRRQHDAGDREVLEPSVEDRLDRVARFQAVGVGEGLAGHHLQPRSGARRPAAAKVQVVQRRSDAGRQRDQPPDRGLGHPRHVQRHRLHDPRLHLRDPRDLRDAVGERLRCPLQVGEHLGEAVSLVVRVERALQRPQRAQ